MLTIKKNWQKAESLCTQLLVCIRQVAARAFELHFLAGGSGSKSTHPLGGQEPTHLTQYVTGPHKCTCRTASKSVEPFNQGAWMWQTTDRRRTTLRRNA